MTAAEFLTRYQATEHEVQIYVDALPLWVNLWRGWMFLVFTSAFVFMVPRVEARWVALTMVVSLFAYNVVAMFSGAGRLPSVAFLGLWSPLAIYLYKRRDRPARSGRFERVYSVWLRLALGTLIVSLTFDVYNVLYALVQRAA